MRPVQFVGSSRADPRAFPDDVRTDVGHALRLVQQGRMPDNVGALHGFGSGVAEIREDGEGGTYRAVYTLALPSAVYVLHAFHKKSPHGAAMSRKDTALVRSRLAWARRLDAAAVQQKET